EVSAAAPQPKVAEKVEPANPELAEEIRRCYSNLDLSFENTQEAFKLSVRSLQILAFLSFPPDQRILTALFGGSRRAIPLCTKGECTLKRVKTLEETKGGASAAEASYQQRDMLSKPTPAPAGSHRLPWHMKQPPPHLLANQTADIIRALLVLRICGIEPMVKHNQRILSVLRATLGQSLFKKLLKSTFFGHFVAGESREESFDIYLFIIFR
ncbi:hypothetical protein OSTOST_11021, partial [Ostertagia ostertagi]